MAARSAQSPACSRYTRHVARDRFRIQRDLVVVPSSRHRTREGRLAYWGQAVFFIGREAFIRSGRLQDLADVEALGD